MRKIVWLALPILIWTCGHGLVFPEDAFFITVGDNQFIALSTNDGDSWEVAVANPGTDSLNAVAHGNGRIVAVGNGGLVMYSDDGRDWPDTSVVSVPGTDNLVDITHTGSYFAAIGTNTLWTSSDGITWVDHPGYTGQAGAIVCDATNCYIAEDGATGVDFQSFDISTTTLVARPSTPGASPRTPTSIDYDDNSGYFVVTTFTGETFYSSDPTTSWTTGPSVDGASPVHAVAAGFNDFTAVTFSGTVKRTDTSFSSWTDTATAPGSVLNGIALSEDMTVVVGDGGNIYNRVAGSSSGDFTQRGSNTSENLNDVLYVEFEH